MGQYAYFGNPKGLSDEQRSESLKGLIELTRNYSESRLRGVSQDVEQIYSGSLFDSGMIRRIQSGQKSGETFYKCVYELPPSITVFFDLWAKDWEKLKLK